MLLLGCVADDFTGATDLANALVAGGLPTELRLGVPDRPAEPSAAPRAVVLALKSRTAPVAEAVRDSVAAARWLIAGGTARLYFKVCSTFDSTARGNIGQVADALYALQAQREAVLVCPAFPTNGRTVYRGHLFVGDLLLSDSPMRHHPLTPMTDASLVRVMASQTAEKVGLIALPVVREGAAAVRHAAAALGAAGTRYAVADAVTDADLLALARAALDAPLVVAGSGIGALLPAAYREAALLGAAQAGAAAASAPPALGARAAVIAGSCSAATQTQVAQFAPQATVVRVDPLAFPDANGLLHATLHQVDAGLRDAKPLLVVSTVEPDVLAAVQSQLGRDTAAARVEHTLAAVARHLVDAGVRKLVVAGGETSGAVVGALGVDTLDVGPQIAPGVPWTFARGGTPLALALKSGNFGQEDFFARALAMLS